MIEDTDRVQALESGVLILSGGRCVSGCLIVSVPTSKLEELAQWSTQRLTSLFSHLATISKYLKTSQDGSTAGSQTLTLTCLADLRHASTLAIKQLTECLESVEHQHRGCISAVYFLKPRNKTRSRILKKQLGLKPSKKRPRIPLFKVVLMKTFQELHIHIDVSQLTADFCGILRYSHDSWMHLYNAVIKCIEGCHNLLAKLPSVRDKVDLLQEYETDGQTSSQVQQLLADLIEKFHIILSESSLPLYLTLSKQTLFLLDHPSSDSHLSLVHPELVAGLRACLHGSYLELDQWNTDLEDVWRLTESRLTVLTQVHRHRERAREIERKICEHYHPLLREHPIVGKTLSQAELYRAHFTASLYDPAKELLSQATEILEAVQRLKNSVATQTRPSGRRHSSTNGSSVLSDQDIMDISKCLTTSIQPFTTQLQHLQQVYVSVHIFHLLFEKALIWYKKVLKFIPESLLQMCSTESELSRPSPSAYSSTSQEKETLVYMPSEWLGAVRVFLTRHPPPREEHVDRIDENIPQLVDRRMRSQARSLALRLRLLQRTLAGTRLPLKVVTAVLTWRAELFGPSQQEKTPVPHHAVALPRDVTTTAQPTKQENDKRANRGQLKPHFSRVPEKPPRNRKMASLDREAHAKARVNSLQFVASTGAPMIDEQRGPEKSSVRKNSSKLLPRSKSVDFNFNSSSTDGSVFDYDKALVQAETMADAARTKMVPRKSRSSIKEAKSYPAEGHKTMWKDYQTFSDSTDLLKGESRSYNSEEKSSHQRHDVGRSYTSEPGSDKYKYGILGHSFGLKQNSYFSGGVPEPEPVSSASPDHSLNRPSKQILQRGKEKQFGLESSVVSPSTDERFIRITFTPQQLMAKTKTAFRFSSEEVLETTSALNDDDDGETDNELAQRVDRYDNVVNRIREISTSNLTNIDKLKKVSELLSLSTLDRGASHHPLTSRSMASNMSHSTMDLRATDQDKNRYSHEFEKNAFSLNEDSNQTERHVNVVLRMKKNLAKSMEELNLSTSYPQYSRDHSLQQNPATSGIHEGLKLPSEPRTRPHYSRDHSLQQNPEGLKLPSEPRTRPDYSNSGGAIKKITAERRYSQNYSGPDDKVLKHFSLSTDKTKGGPRSWSDVESFSQGLSASLSSQDPTSHSKQSPSPVLDSSSNDVDDSYSRTMTSRFIPDESDLLEDAAPNDGRRLSVTRATGPSLFSSRNFISPSFLRPASSMRNLSTEGHPDITFGIEMDLEHDYQALEDLEILRTIQDEPLSKEFSNYASKAPRKQSSDHTSEKLKDDQRKSESTYKPDSQHYRSGKTGSQHATRNKPEVVPEIRVSHLSQQWPSFGGSLGDGLSYLSASDVNFDRLTTEADKESMSQEEVAESLRKTQQILKEEEARRFQRLRPLSDPSLDEEEGDELGAAGGLSHTTSLDNGYGSWASKHMYSTSSDRDWRKLSTSSADSSSRLPRNMVANIRGGNDGEDETSDVLYELP